MTILDKLIESGYKQTEIARKLGVSRQSVNDFRKRRSIPKRHVSTLINLLPENVALNCPFCGAEAKCENGYSPCESVYLVSCSNTDCFLYGISDPPSREEWNARCGSA